MKMTIFYFFYLKCMDVLLLTIIIVCMLITFKIIFAFFISWAFNNLFFKSRLPVNVIVLHK